MREVAAVFLKLGLIGFGGPAAHIALMRDELVRRRNWVGDREFLDLLALSNLVPGPTSTELALHLGRVRGGWPGMLAAGAVFILPATLLTLALAWLYVQAGTLPRIDGLLAGVRAAMVAVLVDAIARLAPTGLATRGQIALGALAFLLSLAGLNEIVVMLVAAVVASGLMVMGHLRRRLRTRLLAAEPVTLTAVFLAFLKIGALLYGTGYVLIAYFRAELVARGWLSDAQVLDAIAAGQMTPGPVNSSAAFAGYLIAGLPGAAAATIGIFLPAFVFVAVAGVLHARLSGTRTRIVTDALVAASLGLLAAAAVGLGERSLVGAFQVVAFLATLVALRLSPISAGLLIAGAALAGLVVG